MGRDTIDNSTNFITTTQLPLAPSTAATSQTVAAPIINLVTDRCESDDAFKQQLRHTEKTLAAIAKANIAPKPFVQLHNKTSRSIHPKRLEHDIKVFDQQKVYCMGLQQNSDGKINFEEVREQLKFLTQAHPNLKPVMEIVLPEKLATGAYNRLDDIVIPAGEPVQLYLRLVQKEPLSIADNIPTRPPQTLFIEGATPRPRLADYAQPSAASNSLPPDFEIDDAWL